MNPLFISRTLLPALLVLLQSPWIIAHAQGTAFSYQGKLSDGATPANGTYDFQLSVHDSLTAGNQVGSTLSFEDVTVTGGVFTLYPDFGGAVFTGGPRWLEVAVRNGASTGTFTPLNPRQPVLTTPYAQRALIANAVPGGAIGSAQIASGSITADKLAPGVSVGGATPTGSILGAFAEDAAGLMENGYTQVPGLFTELGGWNRVPELSAAPKFMQFSAAWTGSEWFCLGQFNSFMDSEAFGYGDAMGYLPAKFNPSTGLWTKANTNNGPQFMSAGSGVSLISSATDVFAFGHVNTFYGQEDAFGWRYNITSGTWSMISTNGFGRIASFAGSFGTHYHTVNGKLFVLGQPEFFDGEESLRVGIYDPDTGAWTKPSAGYIEGIDLTRKPLVAAADSRVIIYTQHQFSEFGMVGARFNVSTSSWEPMSSSGGPLLPDGPGARLRPMWTGTELFVEGRTNTASFQPVFFLYNPTTDSWRKTSQTGTPQYSGMGIVLLASFWTGAEVGVLYGTDSPNPDKRIHVSLYNPETDAWRTFTDTTPLPVADIVGNESHRSVWVNGEALVLGKFQDNASDVMGRLSNYRFTPLRTVYLFQKQSGLE